MTNEKCEIRYDESLLLLPAAPAPVVSSVDLLVRSLPINNLFPTETHALR